MPQAPFGRTSAALAFATAFALAQAPSAQAADSNYLLPSISALKPDGDWPTSRTGWGGGLKYGMPLSPSWDLQMGVNHAQSKRDDARYKQTLLGLDGLYFFQRGDLSPFVLIGAGAERDQARAGVASASGTSPYVNLGAGLQYRFSPTLGLQADLRHVMGSLRHDDEFGFKRSGNTYLNVGLIWSFGAPPVMPARKVEAAAVTPPPAPRVEPPPPPPAPLPPPPPPAPPQKFTLQASELFAFDRADLKPGQPKLDELARVLKANPGIANVRISGHTDRLGSGAYNLKLSQRRANEVKRYLVAQGVAGARLEAVGKGETEPVSTCDAKLKRAELIKCLEPDRRVEVEPVTYEAAR